MISRERTLPMGRDSDETVMAFERRRADVPSFVVAAVALVAVASLAGLCLGAFGGLMIAAARFVNWMLGG